MTKKIRNYIHYCITIYLLLGGLFTNNCILLKIYFVICSLTIIHWLTNNNKCFLSQYDYEDNEYTRTLFNIPDYIDSNILSYVSYGVMILLLFTYYKLKNNKCNIL